VTHVSRLAPVSRRRFLQDAAAATAALPLFGRAAREQEDGRQLFRHGVASGDPLSDRIILWTRITPPSSVLSSSPLTVRWRIATNETLTDVVASGVADAPHERDYTVKVDAGNLRPAATYYYAFDAGGEQSPTGRTRTLPIDTGRLRLATVSCSNYPAGYFNVYRAVANRDDLDAVVHVGDYIYEFGDGVYGNASSIGRAPLPRNEAITLNDYRTRYAVYRSDIDLQAAHHRHPFIAVWDDHELANDAWAGGAATHTAAKGDWAVRQAAAYRAYLEWMPIRESSSSGIHLYRSFRIGPLADLIMLDTRGLRDRQATSSDTATLSNPARSILGAAQETWLFDQLRTSQRGSTTWRILGQQVLFAPLTPPGVPVLEVDAWDGYPAARGRLLDFLSTERIGNVVVLTGDIHSSWGNDVPRDQLFGYQASTGAGSLAVELVTPAISSPPLFSIAGIRERAPLLRLAAPHVKYLDGERRGYVLLDITPERVIADWYHVPTVTERTAMEAHSVRLVCERGSSRLTPG
jgi:alkaline phosphatase D